MKVRLSTKSYKITDILLVILVTVFALIFFVWLYLLLRDPAGSQRGVFLVDRNDWFMDWFNVVYYSIGKTPYTWGLIEERSLPPLTFLLLYPFSMLYDYDVTGWVESESRYFARYAQLPMIAAVAVLVGSYLVLFYALSKSYKGSSFKKISLFLVLFFSGINLYELDRMNLQCITAGVLFLYVYLCDGDNKDGHPHIYTALGLVCLAFAADLKIFPAIFGVLLLYRKKWKDAIIAFILGVLGFILPFLWMEQPFPDVLLSFIESLRLHGQSYLTIADFGFSTPMMIGLTGLNYAILQGVAYIFAIIALLLAWTFKSPWKKIMLLSLTLVLTSGQQGYYCLMFLFLPIILFFNEEHNWIDILYIISFVIILSPLQRTAYIGKIAVSSQGFINIVMIVLYVELLAEAIFLFIKGQSLKQNET